MTEKFVPVFGRALASEEIRYGEFLEARLGNRDRDFLYEQALKIGGDTLSTPELAVRIALSEHLPIDQAVRLAHLELWR